MSDFDKASIKRLAWTFGCSKKGSDEEIDTYRLLVERIKAGRTRPPDLRDRTDREPHQVSVSGELHAAITEYAAKHGIKPGDVIDMATAGIAHGGES